MIHIRIKGRRFRVNLYRFTSIMTILFTIIAVCVHLVSSHIETTRKSEQIIVNDKTSVNIVDPVVEECDTQISEPATAEYTVMRPESLSAELYDLVILESEAYNIPAEIVLSIMKTETQSFNTEAINYNSNGTYDSGIMQINSSNINWMAETYNCPEFRNNPKDAKANITVGIRHLASIYNAYFQHYNGDITKCLLATAGAYNRGISNQNKYRNVYEYSARVFAHYSNIVNHIDTNINYAQEIPQILAYLKNEVIL